MATRRGKYIGLKGNELLFRINELTGSKNLLDYKGNLRDIAAKSGFLTLGSVGGRINKGGLIRFCRAYYQALKDLNLYQNDIHSNYEVLYEELYKKYEAVPIQKKKLFRQKDLINEKSRPQKNINENQLKSFQPNQYETLSGLSLLEKVLALYSLSKTETSICVNTGYKIDKIGTFRRAFSKAAGVQLAPLNRMIKEMREKELLSKDSLEHKESKDLFIDREKITTQVNRRYRNPKFREKVLNIHGAICSCCDIAMEELIEAAHIIPVENNGNDNAENGIPLCPTHHTAFDNFLFTINPSNNSIIFKDGLAAEEIQITKTRCELNVSKESLEYRYKLFNED